MRRWLGRRARCLTWYTSREGNVVWMGDFTLIAGKRFGDLFRTAWQCRNATSSTPCSSLSMPWRDGGQSRAVGSVATRCAWSNTVWTSPLADSAEMLHRHADRVPRPATCDVPMHGETTAPLFLLRQVCLGFVLVWLVCSRCCRQYTHTYGSALFCGRTRMLSVKVRPLSNTRAQRNPVGHIHHLAAVGRDRDTRSTGYTT